MKNIIRYTLCFTVLSTFVGCAQQETVVEGDVLQFLETGEVSYTICSEFDQSYYNLEELHTMAESEIDNKSTIISRIEVLDGEVILSYLFDSNDSYDAFVDTESYFGSVKDYKDKGYSTQIDLTKLKSEDDYVLSDESLDAYTLVCWSDETQLVTEDKILYTSKNLKAINNKNVVPEDGQAGPYYVIYK